jgi:hypothetical protein
MTPAVAKRTMTVGEFRRELWNFAETVGTHIGRTRRMLQTEIAELRRPIPAWAPGTCAAGQLVVHRGSTWQATVETATEPPHEDWICVAAAGRSLTVRGTWHAAETYRHLDVVTLNGGSFAARRDDPGPCPGEGWQLIAGQGKRGRAPAVASMTVSDRGVLTLRNDNGSSVSVDLAPLLRRFAEERTT